MTRIGSLPLNIHEVWPRPFWGEAYPCYRRKKILVDHFIGHIPLLYKKLIKPDMLNQNQECLNILCLKLEKTVMNFKSPPMIKIVFLFARDLWVSPSY